MGKPILSRQITYDPVFALVRFVVPAHNADIAVIGQKIFNGVVGARFSAAKLGEASRN